MAIEAATRDEVTSNRRRTAEAVRVTPAAMREDAYRPRSENGQRGEGLAHGLGWFSLGLGLTQLAAPGDLAGLLGVRNDGDNRALLRTLGLRELASGLGILTQKRPAGMLWGRVAGDVMDLLLLGTAAKAPNAKRERLAIAAAAVLGVAVLDVLGSRQLSRRSARAGARRSPPRAEPSPQRGQYATKSITINHSRDEVYRFWHDFENLPRFMQHLESVQVIGGRKSHWKAKGPAGTSVEWDAELVDDEPNELISWRSLEGADVDSVGRVRFVPAPGGRGTEVHVEISYRPPGGILGKAFAKLFGEAPDQQLSDDLRHLKQMLELGELVHSDASIHRLPHPGQPPKKQA